MAVQEHNLLESVIGQRFRDVEHVMHEVLEIIVDRAGKIHDMPGVPVTYGGQNEYLIRDMSARAASNLGGTDDIDIEGQMRAVLLHRSAPDDAHFAHFDGIVDFRPS